MAEALDDGADVNTVSALEDMAIDAAEMLEKVSGEAVAVLAYRVAVDPSKRTITEHLKAWLPDSGLTVQTQQEHLRVLAELLGFLGLADCLAEDITEKQAMSYVENLNEGPLKHATKKGRLSSLGALWRHLERKRAVPQGRVKLWQGHYLTGAQGASGPRLSGAEDDDDDTIRRPLSEAEVLVLLNAPDATDARPRTYTRALFRELYAIGLTTGMRLNEIVSLRPGDIVPLSGGGLVIQVRKAKTAAGVRSIPVTHAAAVAVLSGRVAAQQSDPDRRIFSECVPGGPDRKPSWQVSKAMGRDRSRLSFPPGAVFHSTRANFATLLENKGATSDHIKRYVGHVIDDVLRKSYAREVTAESLRPLANAVKYGDAVESALRRVVEKGRFNGGPL